MRSIAILPLLMTVQPLAMPAGSSAIAQDQSVQVWLNRTRDLNVGDRVRVYLRTEDDGHVVVLHADPEGRIRVLFPLDPFADDFVRGGRDYEIRDRQDRPPVRAVDAAGFGTIYVAYSPDPFRYGDFSRGDHWDYEALSEIAVTGDAQEELTEIAQHMAVGSTFDYELETYYLNTPAAFTDAYSHYGVRHRDYGHYDAGARFSFRIGFYPRYGYYGGSYYNRRIGLFYDPFYYDPFYYDPFYYDPFYYRPYGSRYSYGYRGGYGSIIVYQAGPSVNYNYTFRNRASAGTPYRDRRQTRVGTLARATRQRAVAVRTQPRRASSVAAAGRRVAPGRRTATSPVPGRSATDQSARTELRSPPSRRTAFRSGGQTGGNDGAAAAPTRRSLETSTRLAPERRPSSASGAQTSSRRATPSRRVPEYRVAPRVSPRRSPSARPQPGTRAQPERRSLTPSSRVAMPQVRQGAQSGRSGVTSRGSQGRSTTRIAPRSRATGTSRGQLQRRSSSRSSAITPSRTTRRTSPSRSTGRSTRAATSARSARPSGASRRPPARSTGSSRSRASASPARRSSSGSSRTRINRSSRRRGSNP